MIESIKANEGFESKPYIDPLVMDNPSEHGIPNDEFRVIVEHLDKLKLTFGYGFTFITKEEAQKVLELRILSIADELEDKIPNWFNYPQEAREVLTEMAYQLGVTGLLQFKKFISYLDNEDYYEASQEMLRSKWARQTPNRAKKLSNTIKDI